LSQNFGTSAPFERGKSSQTLGAQKGERSFVEMRTLTVLFTAVLLVGTVMAQSDSSNAQSSGSQQQQGDRTKLGGTPAQERITKEVHHELVMLPYYSVFDNLAYKVEGNTVTLLGQVSRPTLKSDAERSVKGIEGVETVNNQIEVLPTSPNDDQLRRATYRAIYGDTVLSKYGWGAVPPIHIIVNRGRITLEGVVDNEGDKNIAEIRAKSVPGAFGVTNNLRVVKSS
jgi:hyperosmotically inducible protein